jgi:hypothetical protein
MFRSTKHILFTFSRCNWGFLLDIRPLVLNKDFDCTNILGRFELTHAIFFPRDVAPLSFGSPLLR